MHYTNLRQCVVDLQRTGQLIDISVPVDPFLEMAAIQRRVYAAGGPALLFSQVKGCRFPAVGNLFGTKERTHFIFRGTLDAVRQLVRLKIDPMEAVRKPWQFLKLPFTALHTLPKHVRRGPILAHQATVQELPQIVCWPQDGGAFVTLPLVYTEHPAQRGWRRSNLGMYRVQLSGNDYQPNAEVGLHYQIHRGIGVHHAAAIQRGERLPVHVLVGGPPALTLAAVMPLPEGLPELLFAGALGGRRIRLVTGATDLPIPADVDFCISGWIDPHRVKPEGPFGDHLGYYSLRHPFPVMTVERVFHRAGAIWPFTVVGRPPQEDTSFGDIIHEITGPVIPSVLPGIHAVHAVDAAGVHPLLLAIGSERYVPYAQERRPQELLTQANALLGQGQLSLAKVLFIVAHQDAPTLDIHDLPAYLRHVLERVDWEQDLHFQTRTTIDTLDYSAGMGLNAGSKVVIAVAGPKRRELATTLPSDWHLPSPFTEPHFALPGVLVVRGPRCTVQRHEGEYDPALLELARTMNPPEGVPLLVVVDDSAFAARTLSNWLWNTFTRFDPASDLYGTHAFTHRKHWGCRGTLIIDARLKPHHAPPLEEDPTTTAKVESLATRGGPLHGII